MCRRELEQCRNNSRNNAQLRREYTILESRLQHVSAVARDSINALVDARAKIRSLEMELSTAEDYHHTVEEI